MGCMYEPLNYMEDMSCKNCIHCAGNKCTIDDCVIDIQRVEYEEPEERSNHPLYREKKG